MNRRLRLYLLLGTIAVLASCNRPVVETKAAGLSSVAESVTPQPTEPDPVAVQSAPTPQIPGSLSVESARTHVLQPGVQLHVWKIRATGVEKLTSSLMIIREGELQNAAEVVYQWEKGGNPQGATTGQIMLLVQDGKIFDAKDKVVPLLTVDFPDQPKNTRTATEGYVTIEGNLRTSQGSSTGTLGIPRLFASGKNQRAVLYAELFVPATGPKLKKDKLVHDMGALTHLSDKGRAVVAIKLDWTPY